VVFATTLDTVMPSAGPGSEQTRLPAVHHDEFGRGRVLGVLGAARPHSGTQSIAIHFAPEHLLPLNFQ
jgi:hypothetical protein